MTHKESLKINLKVHLKLPDDAVNWLMMVWTSIQTFDDFADGDEIKREDLNALIWNTTIGMPQNPFYFEHSQSLWPVMANSILKWQASDTVEKSGEANEMSFAWRASFYDLVLFVYALAHGHGAATKNAHLVMKLYGEKFEDYIKEVGDA